LEEKSAKKYSTQKYLVLTADHLSILKKEDLWLLSFLLEQSRLVSKGRLTNHVHTELFPPHFLDNYWWNSF